MEERLRKNRKWLILAAVLIVLVLCIFLFRVKKVTVEGNTFYNETQMAEMFQSNILEKNLLTFWLLDKLSLTPDLAFIREYEVTYPSMNEVHIKLYEKTIVAGIAYINQYIYFDKDGMVLQSTDKPVKGIPLFETKNLTTFTLYAKVQMEDDELLTQILNLSNLFQHYGITWDKVQFNEKNEAFLYSGNIKVNLGKRENYDEQMSALSSVLKQALQKKMAGEIDLADYMVKGTVILQRPKENQKEK